MSTWLITGCSTGLGRHLAEAVLERGHNVVVTARNPETIGDLVGLYPSNAVAVALDVTDQAQITQAVRLAEARFGAIDVLVNNAGYGYLTAIEEGDESEVDRLFATHFFGAVAMIKSVLPGMRARRSGAIVNVSSMGARLCPAGSGYYTAAKAALEGLSGCLRKEVGVLGISVTVVRPARFPDRIRGPSRKESTTVIDDYAETVGKRRNIDPNTYATGDPERAAQAIIAALEAPEPPGLLLVGQDAFNGVRAELGTLTREIDAWQEVSLGTLNS